MTDFQIKSLEISNFRSFGKRQTVTFGSGLNVIAGGNGNGKSNLLAAIMWTLSGTRAIGISQDRIMRTNSNKNPHGVLTLSRGEDTLVIDRKGSGVKLSFNGKVEAKTSSGAETFLEEFFGIHRTTLQATKYIAQGEISTLAKKDPKARIKLIEMLQGTVGLTKVDKNIYNEINQLQENFNVDILTELAKTQGELSAAKKSLKSKQDELKVHDETHRVMSADFQKLLEKKPKVEIGWDRYMSTKNRASALNQLIDNLCETDFEDNSEYVYSQFLSDNPELGYEDLGEALVNADKDYSVYTEELRVSKEKENRLKWDLNKFREAIQTVLITEKPEDDRVSEGELEKADNDLSEFSKTFYKVQADLHEVTIDLGEAEADGGVCSRCGTNLGTEHTEALKQRQKELLETRREMSAVQTGKELKLKRLKEVYSAWAEYEARVRDNEVRTNENGRIKGLIQVAETELTVLEGSITALEEEVEFTAHKRKKWNELRITLDEISKRRSEWELKADRLRSHEEELRKLQRYIDDVESKGIKDHYERFMSQFNELKPKLESSMSKTSRLSSEINELSKTVSVLNKVVQQREAVAEEQRGSIERVKLLKKLRTSMKKFIPHFQSLTVPAIQRMLDPIIQRVSPEFDSVTISKDYGISAIRAGNHIPFDDFSFAQRDTTALALRLALAKIQTTYSPQSLAMMILDEPTSSYDAERTDRFIEIFSLLTDMVSQLIIVSHDDTLKKSADHLVSITMEEGETIVT